MKSKSGLTLYAVFGALLVLLALSATPLMAQGILQLHEPGAAIDIEPREIGIHPPPDVIIIPPHPPFRPPRPPRVEILPAELSSLELGVEIDGQIAKTTLDQTFRNPNNRTLEGTYLFPLPADAAVQNLSLYIDGKPVKCEVLEAKKAREIYEGIVRQMRDPALLEYVDRDLVKLRIFPIEAGQTRRVRFEYSQVLKRDFGLTEYGFPLVARQQREAPIKSVTVVGSIRSDVPMTNLYCPTHELDIVKRDDKYAKFSFEKQNYKPAENLKIFYTVSTKDLGAGLLTFREKDQDGYFMLMIAPREELEEKKILPKDVTFVLDTSGSMSGDKIVQARKALVYCLNSLKAEDRFNVVRFSTESESFSTSLLNASSENVKKGIEFVERFHAAGGTAIQAALQDALKGQTEPGRPHLVVFLTDGMPTIGETNTDRIIDSVKQTNEKRARVFTFGVGHDVNTRLLDTLGEQNGGVSEYVAPQEDIEVKVSNFFSRVSDPVLTDLKIDFGSARVSKQYPSEIHDLFTGSQVKIIGRYSNSGKSTILLKGRMGEKEKAYEHVLDFPEESGSADFLPRLWAIRRVGYLTDNIRKGGEDKELVDEIVALGRQYAIATPYTSLLVLEDNQTVAMTPRPATPWHGGVDDGSVAVPLGSAGSARESGALAPQSSMEARAMIRAESGEKAVRMSEKIARSKVADRFEYSMDKEDEAAKNLNVRHVAGATFYERDGVWIDSRFKEEQKVVELEYGSEAYFDFLLNNKEAAPLLALGVQVVFQWKGQWYRVLEAK